MDGGAARVLALRDLAPGVEAAIDFSISAEDMRAFAALSGDHNPLHVDGDFARGRGFAGEVVYGGLLVAKVSRLIGMELPGRDSVWAGLSLDFAKPLYVGETAQLRGVVAEVSESTGMVTLKLTIRAGGRTIARGRAEVVLAA
jgi:acyl dehydratase